MEPIKLYARYGYIHTLEHMYDNFWQFKSDPKSASTYRLIGFEGESKIGHYVYALDPEGGPFMSVNSEIDDYVIKSITINGIFELVKK